MQTSEKSYRFLCREACPACGSKDFSILYSAPLDSGSIGRFIEDYYAIDPRLLGGAPYELCECASCKLIYQRYVGSNKLLEALYTDWVSEPLDPEQEIAAYRDEIGAVAQSRDGHEIMVASSFTGVPLKDMRVLDYGMGWALWARIARQLGCQAFGIDVAEPRMLYASRHGITTLREDQLEGREFHFINMEQVLEHVVDPLALVERLARNLMPGGILKISVPSGERTHKIVRLLRAGLYRSDYATIMPVHPLEHVNTFRRQSIRRIARLTGLRVVQPGLRDAYAFLAVPGALSARRWKKALKELVRPVYQFRSRSNIYMWLQKPA